MPIASPTEILGEDLKTDFEFERHEEIEALLKHLSAIWDEEDFLDMPPRDLPT